MGQCETFTVGEMDVAVDEAADALSYTFRPRGPAYRPGFPLALLVPFVALPLGMLALVGYSHTKAANRPEWEEVLTAVFAAQMTAWLVLGAFESATMLAWSLRGIATELRFSPAGVRYGAGRVCDLEEVRGLRLFTYLPTRGERGGQSEECLSLVVGEDGDTHGLLGGFTEGELRALAEDIHRRLSAFRFGQGILAPLEPLSVVETTEDEAERLMHTRPARGGFRLLAGFGLLVGHRWIGAAWCLAMFAGLFASGRLVAAAGFPDAFLLGHAFAGFLHVALLVGLWAAHGPRPAKEKTD